MKLDSTNKTILLVSDSHQEIAKLRKIVEAEAPDVVANLGDNYDSHYQDSQDDVVATSAYLRARLGNYKWVDLWGNHDTQYFYENPNIIVRGWSRDKRDLIRRCLGDDLFAIREMFRWYVWIDDYLCTHAGLHPMHLSPLQSLDKDKLSVWLDRQVEDATEHLMTGCTHWLYSAGQARGGYYPVGGLNWLDFNHEFEPIEGLKQIVGHTSSRAIRNHHTDGNLDLTVSNNLCIDCHLNEYLLIRNKRLIIKKYADL